MTQEESRPERILVLYGSHSGTSEEEAQRLCELIPEKLETINVQAKGPMALDDFLEEPNWEPIVIIVVSSFGMGDAPRNARNFRKLCDQWTASEGSAKLRNEKDQKPLQDLQFALLGLGSSRYTTYQENPNAIQAGLLAAGATWIGEQGSADAVGPQMEQIQEWQDALWAPLGKAVQTQQSKPLSVDRLREMNQSTVLL